MNPTHRLKKPWRVHPEECHEESFGKGSLAHVIKRKELPDVVCFLGRKADKLGGATYDIDINGLENVLEKV